MAWQDAVIQYCERQDHGFWSEPVNAATNLAFLLAAAAAFRLWRRQARSDGFALALIVVTAAIGIGSFVFHTVATRGAVLLDVVPIAVFIHGYFFLALRRFFGLGLVAAGAATGLFAAGGLALGPDADRLHGSLAYLPALVALAAFAGLLRQPRGAGAEQRDRRRAARGLAIAAGLFLVSLVFRTVDREICPVLPVGTHFLWHLLNATVLWLLLRTVILARADALRRTASRAGAASAATVRIT
ncbi:ceramidase domain-containing protein [Rhodoplanes sp. TEM]|uniref:Ceramidase domain-containing protein n=1 Tax=Rhodoplanes tepidamans TaxID=200616 RepID=A0ABT5J853_RHOTP|nr:MULTISPECIES: ceramidase domain-containing protein [Rhodoplanes]MDC7785571.1 ceramidase domain-containing protein [Rhodoplanes tepidamans]MDC7985230.1 ceramidase domain-containing protein [Rhodoplanes sp. TEM]MDQ0353259.1 hypothetical protein [Rhodoplanes tepidamans]